MFGDRLMDAIIAADHGKMQMIDSSVVRACIGRSRGGLTTQLHLRVMPSLMKSSITSLATFACRREFVLFGTQK